jgi:N-acetyl-gamma-glutamyl-phosphate reductase
MKAAILGTTGYTGQILLRLLLTHPEVNQVLPVSSSRAGEDLESTEPGLGPLQAAGGRLAACRGKLMSLEQARDEEPQVVFSALPHLESARLCGPFFGRAVVIDLSADFRLRDPEVFRQAYGEAPPRPDLLDRAVYGLPEWRREDIRRADIIANPGCYPTATLLPLLPLLREKLVGGTIVTSALSGVSGAGRKVQAAYLFCERAENMGAYNPGKTHRHVAEMEAELKAVDPGVSLLFTPHLVPLKRGMVATTVAELLRPVSAEELGRVYRSYYGEEPFITLAPERLPQSASVWGTNRCEISWRLEGGRVLLFSAIDNLVKGASGQAVQNMNIRFELPERAGLRTASEV